MPEHFDVVVIGAGPAGSATAAYLAGAGLKTLVLDKFEFPRDKTCGDGLPPRAIDALADLEALEQVSALGFAASEFQIASPGGRRVLVPIPPGQGLPAYTLVIPRRELDALLLQRAERSGAVFRGGLTVEAIEREGSRISVKAISAGGPISISGGIAVLACGANLALTRKLGLLTRQPRVMLAARAYYDRLDHLDGRVHFRFDCLPLPSYGWIFPLAGGRANIGAGFLPDPSRRSGQPAGARQAFERFTAAPQLQTLLSGAERTGPIKGHPLRIDFLTAQTYGDRLLAVGEAAGLVNPLTGDGIDYALESGKLAAHQIRRMFDEGDFSRARLREYDQALHSRFAALFRWSERLRWLLTRPALFDRLADAISRDPALQQELASLVLRARQPSARSLARMLLRGLNF